MSEKNDEVIEKSDICEKGKAKCKISDTVSKRNKYRVSVSKKVTRKCGIAINKEEKEERMGAQQEIKDPIEKNE